MHLKFLGFVRETQKKISEREDVRQKLKEIKIELLPAQKGLLQGFFVMKSKWEN